MKRTTVLLAMAFIATAASGQTVKLIPITSFELSNTSGARVATGIAVDETTIYATFNSIAEMDTYDLSGNFVATVPLTGITTWLGGYPGAKAKSAT